MSISAQETRSSGAPFAPSPSAINRLPPSHLNDVLKARNELLRSPFLGEFVGTMVMILLGEGANAGVLLKRSKAENAGWLAITAGWAFAVVFGIHVNFRNPFGS